MSISPTNGTPLFNVLDNGQIGNVPFQPSAAGIDRFTQALERAGYTTRPAQVEAPVRVAQLTDPRNATDATDPVESAQAAERAVQGLQLDNADDSVAGTGTSILEGLGKLRGMFDTQMNEIATMSDNIDPMSTAQLMQLQAQLVEFSLVVDVTSKLAGKSTMALDSLMKGQ
jgi:type III secretion system YscI/HrpB-like protein